MDREMSALADFETFLSKLGAIPEDKIKFYLHWVRRFLKSCNYQLDSVQLRNTGFRVKPGMTIKLRGLLKQCDSIASG